MSEPRAETKLGEGPSPEVRIPARTTYLALPSRDLGFLKNTLRLYLREEKVGEVVRAFGARCGAGQVVQSQVEVHEMKDLADVVPAMCAQIGLAKIRTRAHGDDHLVLELSRVAEASPRTSRETRMEFTRGFLVGAVAELLHTRVLGRITVEDPSSDRAVVELRWSPAPPVTGPALLVEGAEGRPMPESGGRPPPVPEPSAKNAPGPGRPAGRTGGPGSRVGSGPPSPGGRVAKSGAAGPGSFLLEEGPQLDALSLFGTEAQRRGGLAITAERGKELRSRRELAHVRIYDLAQGESPGLLTLDAGNLPAMLSTVDEFLKRVPGGVVLLTDLPLLLQSNGMEPTRNFLSIVAEMAAEGKGTLLAAAPYGSIAPADRALLLRTLKPYSKGH